MPIARSTSAGIAGGVVLLAAAVGFGVGLPEVVGASDTVAEAPALPDHIAGFTAVAALTPEDAGAVNEADAAGVNDLVERATTQDEDASKALAEQYGDASVRVYVDPEGMKDVATTGGYGQFSATIVPGTDPGLVISGGPYETDTYKLQTIGGHPCSVAWRTAEPGAEPTDLDYQVECRAEVDGLIYDVYALSVSPEDTAAALDELIAATTD